MSGCRLSVSIILKFSISIYYKLDKWPKYINPDAVWPSSMAETRSRSTYNHRRRGAVCLCCGAGSAGTLGPEVLTLLLLENGATVQQSSCHAAVGVYHCIAVSCPLCWLHAAVLCCCWCNCRVTWPHKNWEQWLPSPRPSGPPAASSQADTVPQQTVQIMRETSQ